ncbi:MAG TPA: RHS repeat-associated core domain-containing protein [Acidobacteriaceae bacterium]|nr:RHS repeat-associated core domain-containing protein [Acidobacteriaceae bacterium]
MARYYDSRAGTFCSADPLAGSPDDPQSWNRYAYGRNDPIDITDPTEENWFFSLIADTLFALVPFTGGATLPYAQGFEELNAFSNLVMGQPPWGFGSFGSLVAPSGGGVWNDQWSVPNTGIAGALGLPSMADIGPIFSAQNTSTQNNRMTTCYSWARIRGVGGKQARANGALYSAYPQQADGSIRGDQWNGSRSGGILRIEYSST